jgi:hypothetical protein
MCPEHRKDNVETELGGIQIELTVEDIVKNNIQRTGKVKAQERDQYFRKEKTDTFNCIIN